MEDEIPEGETKWYKVTGEEIFNTLFVEWAEFENHGESGICNQIIPFSRTA